MVIEANLTTSDEIGALVKLVNGFLHLHPNVEVLLKIKMESI